MPDHAHALLIKEPGMISRFIQQWKRKSSHQIKKILEEDLPAYVAEIDPKEPIWQARFYDFNVFSVDKARENLNTCTTVPSGRGLQQTP